MTVENTVIIKGHFITNPTDNDIGKSCFARCTATGSAQSVILKNSGGTVIGSAYLHAPGDILIVEKDKDDTITLADGNAGAVEAWSCAPRGNGD